MEVDGARRHPKKHFVIIKIWTSCEMAVDQFDLGGDYDGEIFYKPNRESIVGNHAPPVAAAAIVAKRVGVQR